MEFLRLWQLHVVTSLLRSEAFCVVEFKALSIRKLQLKLETEPKAGVSQTYLIKKDPLHLVTSFPCRLNSAKPTQLYILKAYLSFVGDGVEELVAGMVSDFWSPGNCAKAEQFIASEMKKVL